MDNHPAEMEYFLKPGYIIVYQIPAVVYIVLGSCVAVSLWDKELKIGGLCHYQFPTPPKKTDPTARFGSVAIPKLYRMLLEEGARAEYIEAQIFGGADQPGSDMGNQNVEKAREVLDRMDLRVVSMDVGGEKGRKVVYHVHTNQALILKANRIRSSDWYPYRDER